MKYEISEEVKKEIISQCEGLSFKDGKVTHTKPMMYCKHCTFQSNDDWEQNDHFKETGHANFLPLRFIHERVGKARLARPWDDEDKARSIAAGKPQLRCAEC